MSTTIFITETNESYLYRLLDIEFAWLEHPCNFPLFGKYTDLTGEKKAGFEYALCRVADYFFKYYNIKGNPQKIVDEYLNQKTGY